MIGPVAAELHPGGETFRTEIEILAFDATDPNSRMGEDVLEELIASLNGTTK